MMFPSDLTLRDYIAVHAMQGLMTLHPKELSELRGEHFDIDLSEMISQISYQVADQMIKERDK